MKNGNMRSNLIQNNKVTDNKVLVYKTLMLTEDKLKDSDTKYLEIFSIEELKDDFNLSEDMLDKKFLFMFMEDYCYLKMLLEKGHSLSIKKDEGNFYKIYSTNYYEEKAKKYLKRK